jgi:hypothetical protein
MADTDPVQKYFDSLLASYDILVEAVEKANERGLKVTKQFAQEVVQGQREAIELGRKFATQPNDYQQFYSAILSSTTDAQGRALAFTQSAYQEAVDAGTDARETVQKLVEANRETARLAMEAARNFATANPWGEAIVKATETLTQTATTETKKAREKATASS